MAKRRHLRLPLVLCVLLGISFAFHLVVLTFLVDPLLGKVEEVERRAEEVGPPPNEVLAEVLEDVGEEAQESQLPLPGDLRRLVREPERLSRGSDEEFPQGPDREVDKGAEFVGRACTEGAEDRCSPPSSSLSRTRARSPLTGGHDTVRRANDKGDHVGAVRRVEPTRVLIRHELEELVTEFRRFEEVLESLGVGDEGGVLPPEEAVERELLDVDVGEGEEGTELGGEAFGPEEHLGVRELCVESEPSEEAKLAFLGRLVGLDVLDGRLGHGLLERREGVLALEATEEDLGEVATVSLGDVGDLAAEGEELCFVRLNDEAIGRNLGLQREVSQTQKTSGTPTRKHAPQRELLPEP